MWLTNSAVVPWHPIHLLVAVRAQEKADNAFLLHHSDAAVVMMEHHSAPQNSVPQAQLAVVVAHRQALEAFPAQCAPAQATIALWMQQQPCDMALGCTRCQGCLNEPSA